MGHGNQFVDQPNMDPKLVSKGFKFGVALAVIGLGAAFAGLATESKEQFFYSWLVAGMTFTTISLGCLFIVLIHHITGAMWSTAVRRLAENIAAALPYMALLMLPVLFIGMHDLYHWTHGDAVAKDAILQSKSGYLNTVFFSVRTVLYFALWIVIARFYRKYSVKQDATGDVAYTFKMRWWAPLSILAYALSVSYAGFDWIMSLDPHWFSTMFGVIIFAGGMVSGFATLGLYGLWLTKNGTLKNTINEWHFHDCAKLMWGFVIFWTYTSFSQYFLIWYGNIAEETAWYYVRMHHGWERIGILVILGHFALPFWVLLSRHMKRSRYAFALVAAWMIFMHYVDLYYMAMPNLHHGFHPSWMDLACFVGIGGVFLAAVMRVSGKDAIVAHRDPQLHASLNYDNF
ncbi:MAG: hypothetical protein CMH52_03885 [Myxococcales bacterium]|nr:hypothetical protein [Myxococcales bacterium]